MSELERLTDLELVPVVELRYWAFSERPIPEGPSLRDSESRLRHWLDCLADAGIMGLEPLVPGSMHVPTSAFTDSAELGRVLRRLVEPEAFHDPDAVGPLDGGMALVSGGCVLQEPSCCGDLADWFEWQSVADYRSSDWCILWIGHPWLSVRAEGDDLIVSGAHESATPEPKWVVNRNLILPAVANALAELESFAGRLAGLMLDADGNSSRAVNFARTFAGLGSARADHSVESP